MADTLPFSVLCLLDTVVSGAGSRAGFHSLTTFTVACIQAAPTVVRATALHLCPHHLHSPPEACKGHHSSSKEGRKPPCAKQRTMTTEGAKVGIPPLAHGQPSVLSSTGTDVRRQKCGGRMLCAAPPHWCCVPPPVPVSIPVAHH